MEDENTLSPQFQIRFFTKQEKYTIPDIPYSIPGNVTKDQLNLIINSVLSSSNEEWENVIFDFLVAGEILNIALQKHLESKEISTESVTDIEYLERYPSPEPEDSLLHDDWVSAVKASPEWILSGCYDNTLHLWSAKGEHKLTIPGHLAPVKAVTWVDIGNEVSSFVSVSHDETAMLWKWNQVSNGVECVHVCKGHSRSVDCVDAAPFQGKFATGSYDRTIKIWSSILNDDDEDHLEEEEASGETLRKKFKKSSDSNKRRSEPLGGGGRVSQDRSPIVSLPGHNEAVTGVQWMDTNELCSISMDHTIKIWDLEVAGLKSQLNGSKSLLAVSYSPLSRHVITASADRHVRLWDPRTTEGQLVKSSFTSHTGWVSCVKWSPLKEHLFVSGSYDKLFKLWDTRSPSTPLYDMSGHEDRILCCDWSECGHMMSGGADNHLKIYKTMVTEMDDANEV